MDVFKAAERLMGMHEADWARHANPLSGWTRILGGPVVFFALWSPRWIGWWSIAVIAAAAFWVWINPRLFPPPETADAWATKGVLGERVFLNRDQVAIPLGYRRAAWATTALSGGFFAIAVYGFVVGDFWTAFAGWHAGVLAKIWFLDRMVWLWELMKDSDPVYQAWARADWTARLDASADGEADAEGDAA